MTTDKGVPTSSVGLEHVGEQSEGSKENEVSEDFQLVESRNQRRNRKRSGRNHSLSDIGSDSESDTASTSEKNQQEAPRGPRPREAQRQDGKFRYVMYFPRSYEGTERDKQEWIASAMDSGLQLFIIRGKSGLIVATQEEDVAEKLTSTGF